MKTTYTNIDITVEDLEKAREFYGKNYDDYETTEPERDDYFEILNRKRCGYYDI